LISACGGQSGEPDSKNHKIRDVDSIAVNPSKIVIPPKGEPGEPLRISGMVLSPDGKTPLKHLKMYVYHTDAFGYYKNDQDTMQHRLSGTLFTNDQGKYEIQTIKPGPYPYSSIPSHVHFIISGNKFGTQHFELLFEGDPMISERIKRQVEKNDSPYRIRQLLVKKDGILRSHFDIILRNSGN
jgi:protocatechuate 3,4-dioxygenase beta subunit